ncbi:MAG: L-2-hydroxyglutarate oxidase [Planctomycetaceae bacterium]|jgi:(S)-2-hydroxyglutarate dehydrogenase|nr:L-2-hydroxyglutarate oxidase [Planctomycetaceae bacterium]MBT6155229.1 L-2-hydroxyglutarate oxidase [Planctomycetaceae bacterium]MBT6483255.1 L-2-hydroxyglutarate oxidase [Planctomycetaceae bacterium]MBT6492930.1 L-2-hydroxyglutarate oxidase [Planctomycetaceae bacterium]
MPTRQADIAIVGGGIVGLATAYQLSRSHPDQRVVILEKEAELAAHQTGRNSGVLHSGIYYKPGSLRAENCRIGKEAMEAFCAEHDIAYDICGKVIVALDESELPALERIHERGQANGVRCEVIDAERLKELEPHAAGIKAIHVPEAGIVDYKQVTNKMAELVRANGGEILTNARVTKMVSSSDSMVIESTAGAVEAKLVATCAGLYSDRVTKLSGQKPPAQIVPFRGEYFELKPEVHHLCRTLIYPVPNPDFPFLGVHFTRIVHGGVECGPNAVLAFAREGYYKTDINLRDLFESLTYPGFLKLAMRNWKTGMGEMWRSCSKRAFVKALQRLLPEIRSENLVAVPAGVRAQALLNDGSLAEDFLIQESDRVVNVCNAPSPAATASLNVGRLIVERLEKKF